MIVNYGARPHEPTQHAHVLTHGNYCSFPVQVHSTADTAVILFTYRVQVGTAVAQWLRCCATTRKDAGSIPGSVSGFSLT